ncbi:hypothetical protein S40288_10976 [Stachybotrys chartarum IBT 40288]|nr:hypothetical protein S40288_10976 [Stachybotrys chartarum IBT 40288]
MPPNYIIRDSKYSNRGTPVTGDMGTCGAQLGQSSSQTGCQTGRDLLVQAYLDINNRSTRINHRGTIGGLSFDEAAASLYLDGLDREDFATTTAKTSPNAVLEVPEVTRQVDLDEIPMSVIVSDLLPPDPVLNVNPPPCQFPFSRLQPSQYWDEYGIPMISNDEDTLILGQTSKSGANFASGDAEENPQQAADEILVQEFPLNAGTGSSRGQSFLRSPNAAVTGLLIGLGTWSGLLPGR